MGNVLKKVGIGTLIIIGILLIIIVISFINNKIKLNQESNLFKPLGKMVTVNKHRMHVYTEGKGEITLVFMAGGGTCSPTLDFRSLYSRLSDNYRIAVVEKAGYGFSEIVDVPRDIDTVLEETRKALTLAGEKAPYVLFPHSMSGIEALYWAQKYPDEITAIVGLDPAVPAAYENFSMPSKVVLNLPAFAAKIGLTRFIPSICNSSAAIKYGSLTDNEKEIYRAIFYRRTATKTMLDELECIQESARKVNELGTPKVPMLFFISNGKGTGWEKEQWRQYLIQYISKVPKGQKVLLDCGHYIHNYEYETIALKSREFINNVRRVKQ
ncbi:alpha/beta hydrolase [Clostridium estertheticum]|uniref:alpha/beta fold hydrolase n=1 Tax=Clostridium estertheticum TaxID=238834 RepID=UPI001C7D7B6C|nr:alpha/beta hydrolase [Clostridium estertheticum]MBX4258375.1 alpha/beta hydrolase [Clostridium estertheticum]WLC69666.1 alpha/beta hydrolase [Clostridium estertheticum]